jgi:hypothetical protein
VEGGAKHQISVGQSVKIALPVSCHLASTSTLIMAPFSSSNTSRESHRSTFSYVIQERNLLNRLRYLNNLFYKQESRGFESFFYNLPNLQAEPWPWSLLSLTEGTPQDTVGGRARPARKPENLTATYKPIVYTMWDPQHLITL